MTIVKLLRVALIGGAVATLGACADGYGYGGGGYGGGVAYAGGYSGPLGYGGDYYGGVGYPGYGFYNDYYYPGTGIYVFDRGGRRRAWNDDERNHWQHRGEFRGNHLYQGRQFDARRDRAYMADRGASYRSFRQSARQGGGGRPQGQQGHGGGRPHN
ncbi:hypothetical protein [Polymorphobacter megasporae]|uniref:hypothetical protein n=1 Tax=Glacieibacterium megasporae TaxID=2835787 RepID=UPI001C1E3A0C|nr:hypothetical protein [Polymorphobacter megasporae]UAJ10169.1 hypothetical protein KTC28_18220 [Polymorphobacter megasporae]